MPGGSTRAQRASRAAGTAPLAAGDQASTLGSARRNFGQGTRWHQAAHVSAGRILHSSPHRASKLPCLSTRVHRSLDESRAVQSTLGRCKSLLKVFKAASRAAAVALLGRHDTAAAGDGLTRHARQKTASSIGQPELAGRHYSSCSRCSASARIWSFRACSACARALAARSG
jgi:hypothetical protein